MKKKQLYEDKQLLELVKTGDESAFTILFNRYAGRLYQITLKYTANTSNAEEVVQDVFTKIWINRQQLKPDLPFVPYLVKIARNLIYNKAKKRLYEIAYLKYNELASRQLINFTQNQVFLSELEELILECTKNMPPKRKRIFQLSRKRGMKNSEIAQELGISESTVENQINKALKDLKKYLQ